MGQETEPESNLVAVTDPLECPDCGQPFKNRQGVAGHRRLAHSASAKSELEAKATELAERDAASTKREAEAAERQRELDETGPFALGLSQCDDCGAWFDSAKDRSTHCRSFHPLEGKVAEDVGSNRSRVSDVWIEACRKQERHPDATPDQIVKRFWSHTDRSILRALLARNAAFRFAKKES